MAIFKSILKKRAAMAIAVVFAAGILWMLWPAPLISDVPVYENLDTSGGDLRVRYGSEDRTTLLITRAEYDSPIPIEQIGAVYEYNTIKRLLSARTELDWKNAIGEITTFKSSMIMSSSWVVGTETGQLSVFMWPGKTSQIMTHGRLAFDVVGAPTEALVAVTTTDGHERFGVRGWFFSFGGGYGGQHYIELFPVPDMKPVKPAIRIPFTNAEGIDLPCWSEDGKYLVIASSDRRRMIVIHTDVQE